MFARSNSKKAVKARLELENAARPMSPVHHSFYLALLKTCSKSLDGIVNSKDFKDSFSLFIHVSVKYGSFLRRGRLFDKSFLKSNCLKRAAYKLYLCNVKKIV